MGPKSLTNLFLYIRVRKQIINWTFQLVFAYQNYVLITKKYDGTHLWNSIPSVISENKLLSLFRNIIAAHISA